MRGHLVGRKLLGDVQKFAQKIPSIGRGSLRSGNAGHRRTMAWRFSATSLFWEELDYGDSSSRCSSVCLFLLARCSGRFRCRRCGACSSFHHHTTRGFIAGR